MAIVRDLYCDYRRNSWHAHAPWFIWHPVRNQHQGKDERKAHRAELRAHKKEEG